MIKLKLPLLMWFAVHFACVASDAQTTGLADLPVEVIQEHIANHLPLRDLSALSQTCKYFHDQQATWMPQLPAMTPEKSEELLKQAISRGKTRDLSKLTRLMVAYDDLNFRRFQTIMETHPLFDSIDNLCNFANELPVLEERAFRTRCETTNERLPHTRWVAKKLVSLLENQKGLCLWTYKLTRTAFKGAGK